ncbi:epidermal growth factor receptor kinase substrate 8 isoform X2 [Denticeps clupeoides]|uniref:epidermal growth factor receptor kinase substrate 8 isoform X2 n=1 Tax=Denticeps clupeoides TaxID=299321 RepID=UPI0010A4486E|nr:epidermal growth factor receptor kinase substrate 8-like isoform X2 [Denticeps clupeoides]
MFRSNGPFGFDHSSSTNSSIRSNGFSIGDVSSQASNLSRPSARSIYMQRKEYAENINKQMGCFQYRVEHLFTCDVEDQEASVDDCIERLKLLDAMGRVWGQDMVLQVQDGSLVLTDIETKEELEALPASGITETRAVLDSCVYDSLLTVTVSKERKRMNSVFIFQCEDIGADYLKRDLDRVLGQVTRGRGHVSKTSAAPQGREPQVERWIPPVQPPVDWGDPDYDDNPSLPPPSPVMGRSFRPSEPPALPPHVEEEPVRQALLPQHPYTERDRNVDILNHVLGDVEAFMAKVAAVAPKEDKKKKMKKKKKKVINGVPPLREFETCMQKVKFGFNLLAELNGQISDPSAPDLVHVLFSTLIYLDPFCPDLLPPSIVAPLLTPECIRFLSEEATAEEDEFWQALGDAWNIPSTKWPEDDEDVPTYTPVFDNGWQPPEVTATQPIRRQNSQPVGWQDSQPISRQDRQQTRPAQAPWDFPATNSEELPPSYMRVLYDFAARNHRELSISKGEVVQLLDMSKQWWKVRNSEGEEGYVPNNVLESMDKEDQQEVPIPSLTKKSKPAEVKAWLDYKGFSKITVRCLGVLSGASLLGMTRDELKIICPEEGGRVFFQLQNIKSAIALASEVRPMV